MADVIGVSGGTLNDAYVLCGMGRHGYRRAIMPQAAPPFERYAQVGELNLGAQILKLKALVRMMVGEHDWFLDMSDKWKELFGPPNYSFDHKGVHFVTLNERLRKGFLDGEGTRTDVFDLPEGVTVHHHERQRARAPRHSYATRENTRCRR